MREIKFRAWMPEDSSFAYFHIGQQWTVSDRAIYGMLCLKGAHFEQFTGLHDKNGKEIYEGDVIRQTFVATERFRFDGAMPEQVEGHHLGRVAILSSKGTQLVNPLLTVEGEPSPRCDGYVRIAAYRAEVIGNIHENPELLNPTPK